MQRTRLRGPQPPGDLFAGLRSDHPLMKADPRRLVFRRREPWWRNTLCCSALRLLIAHRLRFRYGRRPPAF